MPPKRSLSEIAVEEANRWSRPNFFTQELQEFNFNLSIDDDVSLTPKKISQKKKFIPKTIKEEYEIVLPKLIGLDTKDKVNDVLLDYVEMRDEQLLRKILEDSKHIHTAYELRCFINEYIFRNK